MSSFHRPIPRYEKSPEEIERINKINEEAMQRRRRKDTFDSLSWIVVIVWILTVIVVGIKHGALTAFIVFFVSGIAILIVGGIIYDKYIY